ncbi:YdeI/OmpD-associated family protein [Bacillus songklensis]|uniref:YdeI/OmpD-associated family protein n=1 Tax=Bacillus songklensis TaxID=1069116 RepID=A0ABV8AWX0_9BACI
MNLTGKSTIGMKNTSDALQSERRDVEIPEDLLAAFQTNEEANEWQESYYILKKVYIVWIKGTKKEETK